MKKVLFLLACVAVAFSGFAQQTHNVAVMGVNDVPYVNLYKGIDNRVLIMTADYADKDLVVSMPKEMGTVKRGDRACEYVIRVNEASDTIRLNIDARVGRKLRRVGSLLNRVRYLNPKPVIRESGYNIKVKRRYSELMYEDVHRRYEDDHHYDTELFMALLDIRPTIEYVREEDEFGETYFVEKREIDSIQKDSVSWEIELVIDENAANNVVYDSIASISAGLYKIVAYELTMGKFTHKQRVPEVEGRSNKLNLYQLTSLIPSFDNMAKGQFDVKIVWQSADGEIHGDYYEDDRLTLTVHFDKRRTGIVAGEIVEFEM